MSILIGLLAIWLCPAPKLGVVRHVKYLVRRHFKAGRRHRSDLEIEWVAALIGELLAGKEPSTALHDSHECCPITPRAARAAGLGGDVPAALRKDSSGYDSILRSVAGVWEIGHRSGLGLADVLQQMCDGEARSREVRRTLKVELAGPRATARLMSLLPALGLGLGVLLGANPLVWLATTPIGLAVFVSGVAANVIGYRWIRGIVRRVEDVL